MVCSGCAELRKELEEQKAKSARYEDKIRDTVSAYKMLESQKQSLEVALSVLSGGGNDNEEKDKDGGGEEPTESSLSTSTNGQSQDDRATMTHQMEALKQAISTLTLVNKRKEMEFKRDRRDLVAAKNEIQRRYEQSEQQMRELKQQARSQNLKRLREQLDEAQAANERTMTEHGMVLAEVQQQYTKEKRHAESMEKQITEMSQRLAAKDELIKRAENRLKEMARMEQEIQTLRKKAEMTPTVRVMKDELANVKASSEQELAILRMRYAIQSGEMRERDARIEQLEQRVKTLSERNVEAEQRAIELTANIGRAERELRELKEEYERWVMDARNEQEKEQKGGGQLEAADDRDLEQQFRRIYQSLRTRQHDFDIFATLSLDVPLPRSTPRSASRASDATGPVGSFDGLVLSSSPTTPVIGCSRNASSINLAPNTLDDPVAGLTVTSAVCDSCSRELDYFRSLIEHLQRKLGTLEEGHERTKRDYQSATDLLRQRIVELEGSQHRQYAQLTAEAKQKVAELEDELQKQRIRVQELMAEKDREIELTKNSLATFYAQNYVNAGRDGCLEEEGRRESVPSHNLPMDPPQPGKACSATPSLNAANPIPHFHAKPKAKSGICHQVSDEQGKVVGIRTAMRTSSSRRTSVGSGTDSRRRSLDEMSIVQSAGFGNQPLMDFSASYQSMIPASRRLSRTGDATLIAGAAARNIFYEQELCKREQEIGELTNVIRLLETKVRDIEQAMLLKDVQYLQIMEALKEEIRVLEGRLSLVSSQTNLAYLRNIFVQLLSQTSSNGRKHILKAIGAVLQLTPSEMRRIDRWTH